MMSSNHIYETAQPTSSLWQVFTVKCRATTPHIAQKIKTIPLFQECGRPVSFPESIWRVLAPEPANGFVAARRMSTGRSCCVSRPYGPDTSAHFKCAGGIEWEQGLPARIPSTY